MFSQKKVLVAMFFLFSIPPSLFAQPYPAEKLSCKTGDVLYEGVCCPEKYSLTLEQGKIGCSYCGRGKIRSETAPFECEYIDWNERSSYPQEKQCEGVSDIRVGDTCIPFNYRLEVDIQTNTVVPQECPEKEKRDFLDLFVCRPACGDDELDPGEECEVGQEYCTESCRYSLQKRTDYFVGLVKYLFDHVTFSLADAFFTSSYVKSASAKYPAIFTGELGMVYDWSVLYQFVNFTYSFGLSDGQSNIAAYEVALLFGTKLSKFNPRWKEVDEKGHTVRIRENSRFSQDYFRVFAGPLVRLINVGFYHDVHAPARSTYTDNLTLGSNLGLILVMQTVYGFYFEGGFIYSIDPLYSVSAASKEIDPFFYWIEAGYPFLGERNGRLSPSLLLGVRFDPVQKTFGLNLGWLIL